ncbi:DUF1492 domain-containing protein [Heliorestis acidaminivorans]|uniref:DUF1492 domain-containing protein n=1 Tax=Heliorestis acidaminivorans TaxID=553427 RepID=A0A6I0EU63_9FIRM|nr:DUF1492 domain-containing protein [Heliorestis acidaminivorans]KAB2953734.1 DUF1492 domain-containing protein [Heliorestis acidaminivorans]
MNAKEYLSQALWLDQMINSKLEQLEYLKSLTTKVSRSIGQEKVSGGKSINSTMEQAIIKVVDLGEEINRDIDRFVDLKREILITINEVSDLNYRLLLELRYISGKTWDEIAMTLGYDRSWVFRVHGRALKEIEALLKRSD